MLIDKVNESDCEATSYDEFKAAVEQGRAILARNDLTIIDNPEISECAQLIFEKYFSLEMTPADKTNLEAALALVPRYDEEYYTEESYSAYIQTRVDAQELFLDETLLQSDNDIIDAVAVALTARYNELTLKPADTSALETALALVPEFEEEQYTAESYFAYALAVEQGSAIIERDNLTILNNEEIAQAAADITAAYNALEKLGYSFDAADNSTAVIDRDNGIIYGLEEGIDNIDAFVNCDNCTLRYTETEGGFGTGTKVEVIQRGEVVETYYIVIFGDVTGDGVIDALDVAMLSGVANYEFDFADGSLTSLAADLNKDGFIDTFDLTILVSASNFETPINQQG